VKVLDPTSGQCRRKFGGSGTGDGQLVDPYGLAVDNEGNFLVADSGNHRIQIFGPLGGWLRKFGSHGKAAGQLNRPVSVAVGPEGNIVVCENYNHRIQVLQ